MMKMDGSQHCRCNTRTSAEDHKVQRYTGIKLEPPGQLQVYYCMRSRGDIDHHPREGLVQGAVRTAEAPDALHR